MAGRRWTDKPTRRSVKLHAVTLGLVLVISSCGRSSDGARAGSTASTKEKTVEEALLRVRDMVDATSAVVATGFHLERDDDEPTGCEDAAGNDAGTLTADYGVRFALPQRTDIGSLFDKASSYWRGHGYEVSDVDLSIGDPAMEAYIDDYTLALHIVKKTGTAYLGGDTPCLPEAKKT